MMSATLQHQLIVPGALHPLNRGAIDWGPQRLVAYAAWSYIVIVDPHSMKRVQILDQHASPVRKVKWSSQSLNLNNEQRYNLQLASGDQSGAIYIWKVADASVSCVLNNGTSSFFSF
jgi:WD40 repeat protein